MKEKVLDNLWLASYAHFSEETLKQLLRERGLVYFYRDNKTDTELYMLSTHKDIYIVFRGTEHCSFKDILTDISAYTHPYENYNTKIRVHSGVYKAYLSVRQWVHNRLRTEMDIVRPITVLGHSLGGGLATLCAVDIQYNHYIDPAFIGLHCQISGSLKVFNKHGVASYNRRVPDTYNIQNSRDIVTKLPPFSCYKHVGKIIKLKSKQWFHNHSIGRGYMNYIEGN